MTPKGKKQSGDGTRRRLTRSDTRQTSSPSPNTEEKMEATSSPPDVNVASKLSETNRIVDFPSAEPKGSPEETLDGIPIPGNVSAPECDSNAPTNTSSQVDEGDFSIRGCPLESHTLPLSKSVDDMKVDEISENGCLAHDIPTGDKMMTYCETDRTLLHEGDERKVKLCNETEDGMQGDKLPGKRNVRIVKKIVKKKVSRKVFEGVSGISDRNNELDERSVSGNVCNSILNEDPHDSKMADSGRTEVPEIQSVELGEAQVHAETIDKSEIKTNDMLEVQSITGIIQTPDCEATLKMTGVSHGGEDISTGGDGDCNRTEGLNGEIEALERKKRAKTEIFIGGLDKNAKEEDIRNVFEEDGNIVEVRMMVYKNTGKNKGYAFIKFASASDAKKALEKHSKAKVCGKECGVSAVEVNDTIYLGNIDRKWKREDVIKVLEKIGISKIGNVTVLTDPVNPECNRGFAFLELETTKDAHDALKKLKIKNAFGNDMSIKVAWAESPSVPDDEEILSAKSVYAEFLPPSWDEEKLRTVFKKFGEVESITLARNLHSSKRKDFVFVNFATHESAVSCVESFDTEALSDNGSKVCINVSFARLKRKKQKPVFSRTTSKEKSKDKSKSSSFRPHGESSYRLSGRKRPSSSLGNYYSVSNTRAHRRPLVEDPYSRISHGVSMRSVPVYMTDASRHRLGYEYPSYPRNPQIEGRERGITDLYYRYIGRH